MKELKLSKEEFTEGLSRLCDKNEQIILFGAGEIGKRAVLRMDYLGIKNNILCMGDNNTDKIGTKVEGIQVLSKTEMIRQFPEATVIITVGSFEAAELIREDLEKLGYARFMSRQVLLHRFEFDEHREKALVKHGDTYILRQIVVNVTERCTLKCKNCSELMPRFEHPENIDFDVIVESMKRLAHMVTYIQDITLLGGEPLMYPRLPEVCEEAGKLKEEGRVKFVNIVSNATLVPSKALLDVMHKYGITIMFSDYGSLSAKMSECIATCEASGVEWRYAYIGGKNEEKIQYWSCVGSLENQKFTQEEKDNKFAMCNSVYDCNMLYRGKYYFCSFAAFLTGLGIVPQNDDSFDMLRNDISFDQLTEKYHEFMFREKTIEACNYCNMHGQVPVAEQVE